MDNIDFRFESVDNTNIHLIRPLADKIWHVTYGPILSQEQIIYMLPMMYSDERINREIQEGFKWELLFDGNDVVGYIDYKLMEDNRVFLSKIYVDTDRQKQGIGYLLLYHVFKYAKSQNAASVYLTVNKENAEAIAFYERNGFYCAKSEVFDIGNGYVMDDYIYQFDF